MRKFLRVSAFLLAALLALSSAGAWAIDLDTAKGDGLVGERADGYLGLVDENADAEVRALVQDINDKRAEQYRNIATQNGITLPEVEALAGKKTYEKTTSGGWYFHDAWKRKP
jgi:uncharacterized protein YdbL (DUF1318 family)